MEPAEDLTVSPAPAPVFVDDTGRRHALIRRLGRLLVIGFAGYIGLLVVGFARDPRVGPLHLPTFGLPSLGLMTPPAPSVQGVGVTGAAAGTEVAAGTPASTTTTNPTNPRQGPKATIRSSTAPSSTSSTTTTTDPPATMTSTPTTITAPTNPGHGPKSTTTTTTTPSSSSGATTSTTTSTTNRGEGYGAASAKGPDGTGAPGQLRRTTNTTAG